jgi:hypothetical protein
MLFYLKVHGTMTCFITIAGPVLNHYFGTTKTLPLVLGDIAFRWYAMGCIYSLYSKFKHEQMQREKMEASEKAFASYGTTHDHMAQHSSEDESPTAHGTRHK